jgi:hypothetical protein
MQEHQHSSRKMLVFVLPFHHLEKVGKKEISEVCLFTCLFPPLNSFSTNKKILYLFLYIFLNKDFFFPSGAFNLSGS